MANKINRIGGNFSSRAQSAKELAFAAARCSAGWVLGVGREGGWSRALAGILIAAFATPALAGPEGAQVVRGDVNISRNGAETLIRAGRNSIINYRSFDIPAGERVRFVQPDAQARVLNRIYSAQPTRIDGSLIANGRVYIVNPAGVIFSATSRVDTAGLFAAAGRMSDADFLRGMDRFTDMTGRVFNEGSMTANYVALLGKSVGNYGTIDAPQGTVVMASGKDVLIGERGGSVFVRVAGKADDAGGKQASVENKGTINARGGRIHMGAGDVYSLAMRIGGDVKAKDITIKGGKKGQVLVDGKIDASNQSGKGGRVEVLGEKVGLLDGARIDATGTTGGGDVRFGGDVKGQGKLQRAEYAYTSPSSTIDVSSTQNGTGGSAVIWSEEVSRVYGDITARGGAQGGDGGFIETSSRGVLDLDVKSIDTSAAVGTGGQGGSWLIDPRNVTISAAATSGGAVASGIFTPTADDANINVATINTALLTNGTITITTNDAGGAQAGNIDVNAAISKTDAGTATLVLQAANNITVAQPITSTTGTLNLTLQADGATDNPSAGVGDVFINANVSLNGGTLLSSGVNFASNGSGTITAGTVTVNHSGTIGIGAALNSGAGTTALTGTTITQAAAITAGTLTLNGTGTATLTQANSVGAISGTRTGAIDFTNGADLTVGASGLSSGGSTITITNPANTLAINGALNAGAGNVNLNATTITQSAAITAATLDIQGTGTATLTQSNSVGTFTASRDGVISFTNGAALNVGAVTSTDDNVTLNANGLLTLVGAINAGTGDLSLTGSGISQGGGGNITTDGLTLAGSGTFALTNASNDITSINGTVTGAITVVDQGTLLVSGGGLSSTNAGNISLTADDITGDASINAGAVNNVTLTADAFAFGASGGATGVNVTLQNRTAATTIGVGGGAGTIQIPSADLSKFAASGTLIIGRIDGFLDTGAINVNSIDISGQTYGLSLRGASVTTNGVVLAANENLSTQTTGTTTFNGVTSGSGTGTLAINSGGAVTQGGAITVPTVTLAGAGTVSLTNAGNDITTLTGSTTNTISFNETGGFAIGGSGLSSGGNLIDLTSTGAIAINGALNAGAGNISLAGGGTSTQTAAITANLLTLGGTGGYTLTTISNNIGFLGGTITGDLSYTDSNSYEVTGLTRAGGTISLGAVSGTVTQSGAITAANLRLTGAGAFTLTNASNAVTLFASDASGIVSFTENDGFTVGTVGIAGINSSNANVTLTSTGGIFIPQPINVGSGTLAMSSGGASSQTSGITAGTLNLSGNGSFTLDNATNNVGTLTANLPSSSLTFRDSNGLILGSLVSGGGVLDLQVDAGTVTQTVAFSVTQLRLRGAAAYTLTEASNNFSIIASSATGAIQITDSNGFTVGTVTDVGITSGNANVTLTSNGGIAVSQAINTGSGTLVINAASPSGQSAPITAGTLDLRGSASYTLTNASNNVGTLIGSTSSSITYTDSNALAVGDLASGGNITIVSGLLDITGHLNAGANNVSLNVAGGGDSGVGRITANQLTLAGTGAFNFDSATNNITSIGGTVTGAVTFVDADSLSVDVSGLTTNDGNVTLTANSITVGGDVNAGTGISLFTSDQIDVASLVTASAITITNRTAGLSMGVAGGAGSLSVDSTELANLDTTGLVTLGGADTGLLTVGTLDVTALSTARSYSLALGGDSIALASLTLDTGDTLTLNAVTGGATQSGALSVAQLELLGAGTFTLNDASNAVDILAADVNGSIDFQSANALAISTINATQGITSTNNDITLTSPVSVSVDDAITAGTARVTLISDVMAIAATVTGNALTNGGVVLEPFNNNVTIGLGTGTGTLSLTQTELDFLSSTQCIIIGSSGNTGVMDIVASDFGAKNYDVNLLGADMQVNGLTGPTTGALVLFNTGASNATQTGTLSANDLGLRGSGGFDFNDAASNTLTGTFAADNTGIKTFNTNGAMTVGTVTDRCGNIINGISGGGALSLCASSLTIDTALSGTSIFFKTDALAVNATVTSTLGGATIENFTAGTSIGLGGGTGDLNISDVELSQFTIPVGQTFTLGSANAGALSTESVTFSTDNNVILSGATIAIDDGLTLGTTRALELRASGTAADIVTQVATGPGITAGDLLLTGTGVGAFRLANTQNDVTNLAGNVQGAVQYIDLNTLNISGALTTNNNDITIFAPSGITVPNAIDAGTGIVTIAADAVDLTALVTGNGGVTLIPFTAGVDMGLAGAAGAFNLTTTELGFINSTGIVEIGANLSDSGTLTADSIDLTLSGINRPYSLSLSGNGVTVDVITLQAAKALVLNSAGDIIMLGGITAPGGFAANASLGLGQITAQGPNIFTDNTLLDINGNLILETATLVLDSGNGDVQITGTVTADSADTRALQITAGTGDVIVGNSIGNTPVVGNIGTLSTPLSALVINSADSVVLPTVFTGTAGLTITAATLDIAATQNTTVDSVPNTPTSISDGSGVVISTTGDATFAGAIVSAGGIAKNGAGATTLSGKVLATNNDVIFGGNVTATDALFINAGTGGVLFQPGATVALGSGNASITADEIELPTGANSVTATGGANSLILQPATNSLGILLGDGPTDNSALFELADIELGSLDASIGSLTIGRADGSHAVTVNSAVFRSATTIQAPAAGGQITANGILQDTLLAGLTLNGNSPTILGGDIITNGGDILIDDAVILAASVTLDTTNNGGVTGVDDVGNITVNGAIDAQTTGVQGIALRTGSSGTAGSDGVLTLGGPVGAGAGQVGGFNVVFADTANLPSINAAGNVTLIGREFDILNGITTTNNGQLNFTNFDQFTFNTTAINLDGAFVQSNISTGDVRLGTNITTTNDNMFFVTPVALLGDVALGTGVGAGNITFAQTIDGAQSLTLAAGTGAVGFDGQVGATTPLTSLTVTNSGSVALAATSGTAIRAGQVGMTSTGAITINGTPGVNGGIDSDGAITLAAASLTQNGTLRTRNATSNIAITTTGATAIGADLTVDDATSAINIHSGTSGTGDLTFVGTPELSADVITLRAGDGTGGAGTTAVVDADNGAGGPTFAGVTTSTPRSRTLTIQSDGAMTDAAGSGKNLPSSPAFTDGRSAMLYTINSFDSTVTITDGATVSGTRLTLSSTGGSSPNIFVTDSINVVSLTTNGNASFTGDITATGITLFDSNVIPGTITFNGSVSLGGDIISDGEICILAAMVLTSDVLISAGNNDVIIKEAIDAGANTLTLVGSDINVIDNGSLAGTGALIMQPNDPAAAVVLGNANDADAGFDLTADSLTSARLIPGFGSITIGRADSTAGMSVVSATSFADPVTFRAPLAGGTINVNAALTGTDNASFTFDTPSLTTTGALATAGGAVSATGDADIGGVVTTAGGNFSVNRDADLTASVTTGGGQFLIGRDLIANGAIDTTGSLSGLVSVGRNAIINFGITTGGGNIEVDGTSSLGTVVITSGAGDVVFTGPSTLTGNASIVSSGGQVTFVDTVNADATGNNRDLTIAVGDGTVSFNGAVGSAGTTLLRTLSVTANSTSANAVHTTGEQTYASSLVSTGLFLADTNDINITGPVIISQDTTFTATTGNIFLDSTLDSISGQFRAVTFNSTGGQTRILGITGQTDRLFSFAATASSIQTNSVLATNVVTYTGATTLDGGSNPVSITGSTVRFTSPVTLNNTTTVAGSVAAIFDSTIVSQTSEGNSLTINSPSTTIAGAVGGGDATTALGTFTTDEGGTMAFGGGTLRTTGDQTIGDALVLNANTTLESGGNVALRSTVDSDATVARSLAVNTGGELGNTIFTGTVGEVNALASLITNASGTTFLPVTVRTTGAQTYLDDVRIARDNTILTGTDINFDRRLNSDTSVRTLTLNGSGQTRFGGTVGGTIVDQPSALALSSITTDAAGTLVFNADVTTTGGQNYGEAATLTNDVALSGNGISFASTILSETGGPPPRVLIISGGAGGVNLQGDVGVTSNLESLTVSGASIQTRSVETTGNQSYTGPLVTVGNLSALGGDLTFAGTANISGDLAGNNVRFTRLNNETLAPTTLAGNILSTFSGGIISFVDALSLMQNSTITATAGTVRFGGIVNSADGTARQLSISNSGNTFFDGAVGNTNPLSSLITDFGGTTQFAGSTMRTTGQVSISDAFILASDTTINAASAVFGSTVDSVDSTPRNLNITTDSSVDATVTFRGAVGGVNPLRRLLVNDQSNVRPTQVASNITTTQGMVFGGPLRLTGDSTMNGGAGTLFFRGAIDTDSTVAPARLTVLSDAVAKLATNGTATDISNNGSTDGDVTVIPFRFGGAIGAGRTLGSLNIGNNLSSVPVSATAVFADSVSGGGFQSDGGIVQHTGMFANNSTSSAGSTFTVLVNSGGFSMGTGQKLTAFGNISIRALGQTVSLGDLTSTGRIEVFAREIALRSRNSGVSLTNVLSGGTLGTRRDYLVDYVAKSTIDFVLDGGAELPPDPPAAFATDDGLRGAGLSNKIFGRFENPERTVSVVSASLFTAPGASGASARLLPIDLVASQSPTNVASALAGAIPRDNREREVAQAIILSTAFGKTLENMQLFTRTLDAQSLADFLVGRSLYQDVPATLNPSNADRKVTLNRLATQPVLRTIQAYCDLAYEDGAAAYDAIVRGLPVPEPRIEQLKDAVIAAWDDYVKLVGEDAKSGLGFRSHLESMGASGNQNETNALMALNKTRTLLSRVDEIGLSPRERRQVREAVISSIGGGAIDDLEAAVVGQKVVMVTP